MRVLVVHNAYQHKGGEDSVMEAEVTMLAARGHSIMLFLRHNDSIHKKFRIVTAFQTIWSAPVGQEFEATLRSFKPDVVHVHNTFPLISPSIYWVADRLGVPVVQTLHNFRLLCPQAMFLRNGKICEDCLGKLPWRGIVRGCYRESKAQSTILAGMITLHRSVGTWKNKISRYIALNEFCRRKFIAGGLPAHRIMVKPNFVDFEFQLSGLRSGFLFVGRLSSEKGVAVLVEAARAVSFSNIRVAGTGPEASLLFGVKNITELGSMSSDDVRMEMGGAMALLLPSIWYENFPRTLVEAFGSGLPVIASRIGALAELVEDGVTGLLFEPGNSQDLAEKMQWAHQHPEKMAEMGRNARVLYETEFTADRNHHQLITIYEAAINATKERLKHDFTESEDSPGIANIN